MVVLSEAIEHGYLRFADNEARNNSSLYEDWATQIARSSEYHEFLSSLPEAKRQPNLLFAAIRLVTGRSPQTSELEEVLRLHAPAIKREMMTRSTQTNEPGRCAVILPLLARLPQPIALIEVGASAGLCLIPELYAYNYNGGKHQIAPEVSTSDTPVLHAAATGNVPLPTQMPNIVWRAGLELNPLDLQQTDTVKWLETLIWPGQESRLERLRKAMTVARGQSLRLVKGDLLEDLPDLLDEVPAGATPVVFHSAVLNYVRDTEKRDAFADLMLASEAHWISNESPKVFPPFAKKVTAPHPAGRFLLSENGEPRAWTGPHGQAIEWIG